MHGLAVYEKEGLHFRRALSRTLSRFLLSMFSTSFTSLNVLLLFPQSITFFVNALVFYFILDPPSAYVFVFGDFNVHHKDWLTYSGGTDRHSELCYNYSISDILSSSICV